MTRPSVKGRLSLVPTCGGSVFFFFFLFLSFSFRISYANEGKSSSSSSNNIVYNEGAILVATYDDNLATYCAASIKNSFGYESESNRPVYIYAPGLLPNYFGILTEREKGTWNIAVLSTGTETGSDIICSIRPASIECPLHNGQRRRNALATSPLALVPVIPDMLIIVVVDIVDTEKT
jgi:hypothetical protein